jgi:hypothetical protein
MQDKQSKDDPPLQVKHVLLHSKQLGSEVSSF